MWVTSLLPHITSLTSLNEAVPPYSHPPIEDSESPRESRAAAMSALPDPLVRRNRGYLGSDSSALSARDIQVRSFTDFVPSLVSCSYAATRIYAPLALTEPHPAP